jgi:hypothetical protein
MDHWMRKEGTVIFGLLFGRDRQDAYTVHRIMPALVLPLDFDARKEEKAQALNASSLLEMHKKVYQQEALLGFYTNLTCEQAETRTDFCTVIESLAQKNRPLLMLQTGIQGNRWEMNGYEWASGESAGIHWDQLSVVRMSGADPLSPEAAIISYALAMEGTDKGAWMLMDPVKASHVEEILPEDQNVRKLLDQIVRLGKEMDGQSSSQVLVQLASRLSRQQNMFDPDSIDALKQDLGMVRYLASLLQVEMACMDKLKVPHTVKD